MDRLGREDVAIEGKVLHSKIPNGGLPLITYAPRGRGEGGGQTPSKFPLRNTCTKWGRGSR